MSPNWKGNAWACQLPYLHVIRKCKPSRIRGCSIRSQQQSMGLGCSSQDLRLPSAGPIHLTSFQNPCTCIIETLAVKGHFWYCASFIEMMVEQGKEDLSPLHLLFDYRLTCLQMSSWAGQFQSVSYQTAYL